MANAEIIAIGSEMLTSQRLDTNSLYITDHLNGLGVEVRRKLVIGDDRDILVEAIRQALEKAEILILIGGLGPTEDDVTRDAVAQATGRQQYFHQPIADAIAARFRSRGRVMPEINKRQAFLFENADMLRNSNGTAPGQWLEQDGRVILLLPGPPAELKPMFVDECLPRFQAKLPAQAIRSRHYRITGLTESDLDQLIAPVYSKYTNPMTTVLAHAGDMQVYLRARCNTVEEAESLLKEVGDPIEAILGDKIYSRNGEALEEVIGRLLVEQSSTLSIAESCTGGLVSEKLTGVPGSSAYFVGGVLAYSNRIKEQVLGVDAAILAEHTAVSEPAAAAMAEGVCRLTGSGFGLAITGEAGPTSATGVPVGTIFVALAKAGSKAEVRRFQMPGTRARVRGFAMMASLDLVRRRLQNLS